jgi:hypothetical protein
MKKVCSRTKRIHALAELGRILHNKLPIIEQIDAVQKARNHNVWFGFDSIKRALENIIPWLDPNALTHWADAYEIQDQPEIQYRVAIIMAGNIPLVNFHDALAVLVSGHELLAKTSSQDPHLFPWLASMLIEIEPELKPLIHIASGPLKDFDAVMATGSNNSASHFNHYFGKYPHIIRKNRHSIAVLNGNESNEELDSFGTEVFSFYGLGCRNISRFLVPQDFKLERLAAAWQEYATLANHSPYFNNYEYRKAVMLVNGISHLDSGFFLLTETRETHSPIAVIYAQKYKDPKELFELLEFQKNELQCVYSCNNQIPFAMPPGNGQSPGLFDYPDRIDIMKFLKELSPHNTKR